MTQDFQSFSLMDDGQPQKKADVCLSGHKNFEADYHPLSEAEINPYRRVSALSVFHRGECHPLKWEDLTSWE